MKKISLALIALMFGAMFVSAQDQTTETSDVLKSKKGTPILPQAGDYAIGFNAVTLLDFALNAVDIMSNTGQTAAHPGYVANSNNVLVGKYFVDKNTAYRIRVGLNSSITRNKTFIYDDPLTPSKDESYNSTEALYSNNTIVTKSNLIIGGGLEKRRGYGRLQGIYGVEGLLGFAQDITKNVYGLEYNQVAEDSLVITPNQTRILKDSKGLAITFGARAFVGAEYFFAPKMSIGAEFGLGYAITVQPKGKVISEVYERTNQDGTAGSAGSTTEVETVGGTRAVTRGFSVDDGMGLGNTNNGLLTNFINPSAVLTLNIHF